jgi:predicted metal-dependent hydrolase
MATAHLTPDDVNPLPRRMDFAFDDSIPKYFFSGNPVISAWVAAMSTSFPDGERFFIDSVRYFEEGITDPELKKAIKGFIGQEAHHGREHDVFNEWLSTQGLPIEQQQNRLKKVISFAQKHLPEDKQLAITCALEHFTAIMADVYLRNPGIRDAGNPKVEALFYWHAIEETEHKSVAFDVYRASGGSELVRRLIMINVTIGFISQISYMQMRYLYKWGELFNLKAWLQAVSFFWVSPGWFRKVIPSYFKYFRKGFHPWQEDNRELLNNWEENVNLLREGS